MENLHGWIFTYNQYTNKWLATERDNYFALFSETNDNVIVSSDIKALISLIQKYKTAELIRKNVK